jgi:hypothetical protein
MSTIPQLLIEQLPARRGVSRLAIESLILNPWACRTPKTDYAGSCIGGRRHAFTSPILSINPYRLTPKDCEIFHQAVHACRNNRIQKPNFIAVDLIDAVAQSLTQTLLPECSYLRNPIGP